LNLRNTNWAGFLLCALQVTGCASPEEHTAYVGRGKLLFEQGSFEQARSQFEKALQIDSKNVRARFWLAQTLEKLERWPLAAGHYLAIADLDRSHVQARIRLGQLYLADGAADKALAQAQDALRIEPQNPDALVLRAAVMAEQDATKDAIRDVQMALRRDPAHVSGIGLLSLIYLEKEKKDIALAVIEEGIKRNPGHTRLLITKAGIHAARGEIDKATRQLAAIGRQEPDRLEHRIRLARFYVAQRQLDKAEQALRDAVADNPNDTTAKLALAAFLLKHGSKRQAEEQLVEFVEKNPTDLKLRLSLANVYEATEQMDKARRLYTAIIEREGLAPNGLKTRTMLTKAFYRAGRQEEAELLIDEVLDQNPDDTDGLIAHAEIAVSKRDTTVAINDLQAVLRDTPTSSRALHLLAQAYLISNQTDLARENLEKALNVEPQNLLVRSNLVKLLVELGQMDEALAYVRDVVKLMPENRAALEALFGLYSRQGKWAAALKTAQQIKAGFPNDAAGYYLTGLALQAKKRFEESIKQFDLALEKSPDATEPVSQIVKSHIAQGDAEQAIERITLLLKKDPDDYVAQNLFGELMLKQEKFAQAEDAFNKAITLKPDWNVPYARLASTRIAHAIEAYQRGLTAVPNDKMLVTALAQLYEQQGAYEKAMTLKDGILQHYPKAEVATASVAMGLASYETDKTSLERATALPSRLDNSLSFLATLGPDEGVNGSSSPRVVASEAMIGDVRPDASFTLTGETPIGTSLSDFAGFEALGLAICANGVDPLADAFISGTTTLLAAAGENIGRAAFQINRTGVLAAEVAAVPIPLSVTLFALALLALAVFRLR